MSRRTRTAPPRASIARPTATPPWPRWPFSAIAAAAVVAYANALGHPLIFDDASTVIENPTIRSLGASVWGGPAQSATAGRPLVNISLALNDLAGGTNPWGYHAVNLAAHVACALVLFVLLRRLLQTPRLAPWVSGQQTGVATAVALLWAVHPLTSEIVNYATQRTEVFMALACLGTLYCGVRAIEGGRSRAWSAASVAACAAGMACKESMITAPVLMLLVDATFLSAGPLQALRRRPAYYACLFATWILLALLIVEGPRWRSAGFESGVSPWTYLLNQAPLLLRYLRLAVWPVGLVLDYGEPAARALRDVWPSVVAMTALLAATLAAWFWSPLVAFTGTWFFITLAPTSSLVPIATEVGAERRMYLPLMALLAFVVIGVARLLTRLPDVGTQRRVAVGTVLLATAILGGLTLQRNGEYATPLGLWRTVVDRYPSGRAHHNLGIELRAAGQRADAIEQYQLAVATHPDAHYALGFELDADGRHQEAIEHYRTFIRLKPTDVNVPRSYHQIGRSLLALGRRDEAIAAFREALARKPGDPGSLAGLADTLLALERWSDAATVYADILRTYPSNTTARFNMGLALVRLDRDADAREAFAAVVAQEPGNVAAHVNLAYALANTNRYGESLKEFRLAAALEKDPSARADIEQAIAELLGH